jgi:hypothetical protein
MIKRFIWGALLLLLAIALFSSLNKSRSRVTRVEVKAAVEEKEERPRRKLVPDNPEDYGIVVLDERDLPRIQEGWDELLGNRIKKLKSETSLATWAKVEEAIKEEPKKTKEKIIDIDKRIKEFESALAKDPDNQRIKKRIGNLRMLRSISTNLAP